MTTEYEHWRQRCADLEQRLQASEKKASYYQKLAEQGGIRRLRETEMLSHLLAERKQAEEQLRFQAELLDQIQDTIVATDLYGHITYVNESAVRLLQRERAELIGQSVHSFGENREKGATQQEIIDHTLTQGMWQGIVINYASDGAERIFNTRTWLTRNSAGEPTGMIGISTDVTARQQAEEEHRTILTTARDGFSLADMQGRFLDVNEAYCRMLGYSREELLRLNIYEIIGFDHTSAETEKRLENVIQAGSRLFETKLKRKDGQVIDVEISANYLDISGGRLVAFIRDITARKQAEEELRQAKETAETANRLKSEFLANLSHEIRTPLNAILGFADLLKDELTDLQQHEYVALILTSGRTLLSLINDILDLSKIEAGKLSLVYQTVSPRTVCQEIAQIFTPKVAEKGVTFVLDLASNLPDYVWLDDIRLRQILLNLVGNAVKFTEKGSVTLRVKMLDTGYSVQDTGIQHPASSIQFQVQDTGIGIPADHCAAIFNAFEQYHGQSNKYGGTGLGLTITKRLVAMLCGTITVTSEVGKGSTFTVILQDIQIVERVADTHLAPEIPPDTQPSPAIITQSSIFNGQSAIAEVLQRLETEFLPRWEDLHTLLIMDEVEQFAEELAQLARASQFPSLLAYVEQLSQAVQRYDVTETKKKVMEFPELMKQIRGEK